MKMSDQPSMAARRANKMLGIIKKGTQNKGNDKIKPLCKLLRTWQVAHSGPPFTKSTADLRKSAVKGGPGCQNYVANEEQVNRTGKESGKKTSEGDISKSSAKSKVTRHCIWNDYGLAVQHKQEEIASNILKWLSPNK